MYAERIDKMDTSDIFACYAQIVAGALPIAFVFGIGNIIVNTFMTAALGGGLKIGGGRH